MINIDTHFFLKARHVDFKTTIKERSWFANATNHDTFWAVSNLLCLQPRNTAVSRKVVLQTGKGLRDNVESHHG